MYFTKFGHMTPHIELFLDYILLLNGLFFDMKEVHMDIPYISMQLDSKNLSQIVFNKIVYKSMKIDFKNSPKMKFCFFETRIWYASFRLYKN